MPSKTRPEVNATLTLCARTLTGEQSVAVQVANHHPFQLQHPKSKEPLETWLSELELDTLVAFNIDPNRYKISLHALGRPCSAAEPINAFHNLALDLDLTGATSAAEEAPSPSINIINGAYEIHFELRDNLKPPPSIQDLLKWQQNWALTTADPQGPNPLKTVFTFCNSHHASSGRHIARSLSIASLARPREGDVEMTLRRGLGLLSTREIIVQRLGVALGLELEGKEGEGEEDVEARFHLRLEDCGLSRDVGELEGLEVAASDVVKLHVSCVPRRGMRKGGAESGSEDTDG